MFANSWYHHHHHSNSDARQSTTTMTTTITPQPPCQPPPNMSCSLSSTAAPPPRTMRPKLTLQTACVPRTFGRSNTGLSLSFASDPTASPTVCNTFKNAYNLPSPSKASTSSTSKLCKSTSRYPQNNNNSNNNNKPYQLPLGVKSILVNSPLEASSRRQRSVSVSANGGNGGPGAPRRVFFPAKKQVSYRYPLEEEIRTVRFTARHSDLDDAMSSGSEEEEKGEKEEEEAHSSPDESASEDSDSSSISLSHSDTSTTSDDDSSSSFERRKKRKILGNERQIRAVALLDGDAFTSSSSITPQTPQSRTKRRREWKWTLGPLTTNHDVNDDDDDIVIPQAPTTTHAKFNFPCMASVPSTEVDEKIKITIPDQKQENSCSAADLDLIILSKNNTFRQFSSSFNQ